MILAEAGREDAHYCEVHLLPFQIESLTLENIGLFKEFEAKFKKDVINVIYGPCDSGKSTIVKAILLAFGTPPQILLFQNGKWKNNPQTVSRPSINIIVNKENPLDAVKGYRCLIGDGFFDRIPKRMVPEICGEIKSLQMQSIITASMMVDPSMFPGETNMIFLDNSEL